MLPPQPGGPSPASRAALRVQSDRLHQRPRQGDRAGGHRRRAARGGGEGGRRGRAQKGRQEAGEAGNQEQGQGEGRRRRRCGGRGRGDRKSVVRGKRGSVRVDLGRGRTIQKNRQQVTTRTDIQSEQRG